MQFLPCFAVEDVHLLKGGYIGLTAGTGDVADTHDVRPPAGVSPVPAQMWAGVSPVPVQMWAGASPVLHRCGQGWAERSAVQWLEV